MASRKTNSIRLPPFSVTLAAATVAKYVLTEAGFERVMRKAGAALTEYVVTRSLLTGLPYTAPTNAPWPIHTPWPIHKEASMRDPEWEIYPNKTKGWNWRLIAGNGEIIAAGESYTRKSSAQRAVESIIYTIVNLFGEFRTAKVRVLDKQPIRRKVRSTALVNAVALTHLSRIKPKRTKKR